MKRRILKICKWFFGIFFGLILLITAGLYFFKDEICGLVMDEVNKHLNAKVEVAEVDLTFWGTFPNLSVDFNHVFVQDAYKNATKTDTLLFSEQIRLKFNPFDIWEENYHVKSIEVAPGTIQLKVLKNGAVNYNILKPSEDKSSKGFELKLEDVNLENMRFSYKNQATSQFYSSRLHNLSLTGNFSDKEFIMHAKSDLKVIKARSGQITLISNRPANFDIDIMVDQETGIFEIPKAEVFVSNLPFTIKGKVTPDDLDFEVHSKNIQLADVANNFAMSQVDNIKKFGGTGKVFFDLLVHGENDVTAQTDIKCDFGVENGSLIEPSKNMKLSNINLNGKYCNIGGKDEEFLKLSDIEFRTAGGPFAGNLMLTHFEAPKFKGDANGVINMHMLHSLFHLPFVESISGNLAVNTDFAVESIPAETETNYEVRKCEGDIEMRSISVKLEDDKRTFRDMVGSMYLKNDQAGIEDVAFKVASTDMKLNGTFNNIVAYFKSEGNLVTDLDLQSKFIDVEDLGTTSKEEKISDGRDYVLPEDIEANLSMNVGKIKYEKHDFEQIHGRMNVNKRRLHFPNLSLKNADANIDGSVTIEERSPEIFYITTTVQTDNLKFKSLFREWDNFHQEVIGEDNIFGRGIAKVKFEAPFDLRSGIQSKAIKSEVYLKILDGRLKNVDAFKSITESLKSPSAKLAIGKNNIALLEKKLVDLKFETLENTFFIENGELIIPAMEIHSSALDITTSGRHTFDNRIDYRFAFRFRDLKEADRMTEFGEEVDDGTGVHVFMRMRGTVDNPIVEWDKTAKKEQAKENREAEKQEVKSMLKQEFGLFKKDTTVTTYQVKEKPRETIKVVTSKEEDPAELEKEKIKKESKLKNKLKGWKEEAEKDKKEEIDFD